MVRGSGLRYPPGMVEVPIRRILVPLDLGRDPEDLCSYAVRLGRQLGADLLFLSVIDSPTIIALIERRPAVQEGPREGFRDRLLSDARTILRALIDQAQGEGVRATGHAIVSEEPVREILAEAENRGVDLILLLHEPHGSLARLFLGDAADAVLEGAPCPVLLMRVGKTKA